MLQEALCPQCHAGPGTLLIVERWVARPEWAWSLGAEPTSSGGQVLVPVLTCTQPGCDLSLEGNAELSIPVAVRLKADDLSVVGHEVLQLGDDGAQPASGGVGAHAVQLSAGGRFGS